MLYAIKQWTKAVGERSKATICVRKPTIKLPLCSLTMVLTYLCSLHCIMHYTVQVKNLGITTNYQAHGLKLIRHFLYSYSSDMGNLGCHSKEIWFFFIKWSWYFTFLHPKSVGKITPNQVIMASQMVRYLPGTERTLCLKALMKEKMYSLNVCLVHVCVVSVSEFFFL